MHIYALVIAIAPLNLSSCCLTPAFLRPPLQISIFRPREMLLKPMMEEELSFDDLPEDVILKILCRLPVKYLIRFSCVSKRWRNTTLFYPQFGIAHLKLASELGTISRSLLLFQRPARNAIATRKQSLRLQSSEIGDNSLERFPTIPSKENFRNIVAVQSLANLFRDDCSVRNLNFPCNVNITKVMASCNGLLLLRTDYKDFSVWNPSTGFFRKITAVPDFPAIAKEWRIVSAHYGFGYVSSADDYKLVFVETCRPEVSRDDVNMFIFSIRLNSWKVIKVSGLGCRRKSGILLNEAIHWASGKDDMQIYAFDLANEESRQFPGPHFNQDDSGNNLTSFSTMQTVVHLGGCLCVLYQTSYWESVGGMDFKVIEIWMMRDYGVSDSWMKLSKFRLDDLPDVFDFCDSDWLPIFVEEDGTLVIKLIIKKELVRIECRQGEKPVCRDRYRLEELPGCEFLFDVTLYDESLLSVTQ